MVVTKEMKSGGLTGIVASDSAICLCGVEEQSLRYRGYAIEDLARQASFEETAWLLLRGELPTKHELEQYKKRLRALRNIPVNLKAILEQVPSDANMMDVMRTAVSLLGLWDPESAIKTPGCNHRKAIRLVAQTPVALAARSRQLQRLKPGEAAPRL